MVFGSGFAMLVSPTGTEAAQTDLEWISLEQNVRRISSDADLKVVAGPPLTKHLHSNPGQDSTTIVNAFTVDVEDYFQVSAFEKHIPRDQWDRWESRVEANTHRMLQLLDRHGVKATFFVLGWLGERYPQLVRDIHSCGHEIGSHGYWHRLIYRQSPAEFRADLRRSRDVLQDAIGQPVTAHRAASFSITKQSLWALEILVEEGFLVDSSIFPVRHDRYGIPGAEPRLHRLTTTAGYLWEFPPSVVRFAGLNVPVGGGGYFRLYPLSVDRVLSSQNQPRRTAAVCGLLPPLGTRSRPAPHPCPFAAVAVPPLCEPWEKRAKTGRLAATVSALDGCATSFVTIVVFWKTTGRALRRADATDEHVRGWPFAGDGRAAGTPRARLFHDRQSARGGRRIATFAAPQATRPFKDPTLPVHFNGESELSRSWSRGLPGIATGSEGVASSFDVRSQFAWPAFPPRGGRSAATVLRR